MREVALLQNGTLDYEDFENQLNERTRLVCMGGSSNITGTVNDIELVRKLSYKVGAWLLIDAVHYAPHYKIDATALGCDFLLCSAYKFYGPHVGFLYTRTGLLDQLPTDRLRTADQHAPYSIETGTLNHAAIAGVKASIEFIAAQGTGDSMRAKLESALQLISTHEQALAEKLYNGLQTNPNVHIIGPSFEVERRAPTISFSYDGRTSAEVCELLAKQNIFAWDGHFYAIRAAEVLGLMEIGGVTRMGISAYTNEEDIERTLKAIEVL